MGCGLSKHTTYDQMKIMANLKLHQQEIRALAMIYHDIATRHPYGAIDLQNFQLFFKNNGLWAESVFKELDINRENLLIESQFILGIGKIYKSSEQQKAKRLFNNFSNGRKGINFKNFLRIMYNYPKSELKQIFHDQHFFEQKIKHNLVNVQDNPFETVSRVPEKESVIFGLIEDEVDHLCDPNKNNNQNLTDRQEAIRHKKLNSSLTFFLYDKKLNVKMTSIHALVKKYAEMIFHQFKIDIREGQLTENNFIQWVLKHTSLYKSYYGSFHDYVWAFKNSKLSYLDQTPKIASSAKMIEKGVTRKVELIHIKGMLIVHEPGKKQKLLKIIYLEGLIVSEICNKKESGFTISHSNGVYRQLIFWLNPTLTRKWMEYLACYKGINIYQQFKFKKRIGAGKFSTVYEGYEIETNARYAIKQIETYKLSDEAKNILKNEKDILGQLNHSIFPQLHKGYQSSTHTHIVMELVEGTDLYEYLKKKNKLSEFQAAPILKELIRGVQYLQNIGVFHRDLKPDNIILLDNKENETPQIKIIDFGLAITTNTNNANEYCHYAVGTPNFIPPEFLEQNCSNFQKCDNFSIGAIAYFILTGTLPFLAIDIKEVFDKTLRGQFDRDNSQWKKLSEDAKNFISSLLSVDPRDRMQLSEAIKHRWLYNGKQREERNKQRRKRGWLGSKAFIF